MRASVLGLGAAASVASVAVVWPAWGGDKLTFGPKDVASIFCVSKTENKNQVHYGVRLDASCAPVGAAPIYAYWRMLEEGPASLSALLDREQSAYGIESQKVVSAGPEGGVVHLTLRALPKRVIVVETRKAGLGCSATATTPINGVPAHMYNVHVKLRWPFGVDYLLMSGRAVDDARLVREKIDD